MPTSSWTTLSFGGSSFLCALKGIEGEQPNLKYWQTLPQTAATSAAICVIRPQLDPQVISAFDQIHWGQEYRCTNNGTVRHYFRDGWLDIAPQTKQDITVHLLEHCPVTLDGVLNAGLTRVLTINDRLPLHAATFSLFGKVILAVGSSGAGKSTLAAAALNAGGRLISDDNVFIESKSNSEQWAFPLRTNASLRKDSVKQLPPPLRQLLVPMDTAHERKWVLQRHLVPQLFIDSAQIDCLWILQDDHPTTGEIHAIPSALAFPHLMNATPYASSELTEERQMALAAITRLTREVPSSLVKTGAQLITNPTKELAQLICR